MRRRILTAIIGIVVLATSVLTLPLAVVIVNRRQAEAVLELGQTAERVEARLIPDVGTPGAKIDISQEDDEISVAVYGPDGRRLAGHGPARADEITSRPGVETVDGTAGGRRILARPVTINGRRAATIRVAEPVGETNKHIRDDLLVLLAVDVLAVGTAAAIGWFLAERLARPLRAIRDDAVRLGDGDFGITGRSSGVAEIDDTSLALAETAGRLDAVLQRERTFSANASHQLRTPVTSMRLAVESEMAVPRPDQNTVLNEVLTDLDRLETTIETLLAVARDQPRRLQPFDVDVVVARLRTRWEPVLRRHNRPLVVTVESRPTIRISTEVFEEILDVLVDNADRHGQGTVGVAFASSDAGHLAVTVSDAGALLVNPASLFLRRQGDAERHGVGLALARSLAEAEGGRLVIATPAPTTFRLLLPDRG